MSETPDDTFDTAQPPPRITQIAPALAAAHPTLLHSGMSISRYFAMHVQGAIFPVTAGLLLYGWRALLAIALVMGSAAGAIAIWRRIGSRGASLRFTHGLWLALLLALTLPAHLATAGRLRSPDALDALAYPLWPILVGAGVALVIFIWLLGGVGSGRIHPVLLTHLLLAVLFRAEMAPRYILQRQAIPGLGDLVRIDPKQTATSAAGDEKWITAPPQASSRGVIYDALYRQPASQSLLTLTNRREAPTEPALPLRNVIRDRMPPLEDLIIGGHPGPIGLSSAIAIIIGGLFLLYRGVIDFRIPLLIFLSAYIALLILPIPTAVTHGVREWHWLAFRQLSYEQPDVGWGMAITFINYEILASPLLFMAFFLAPASALRPMPKRARALYAILIGLAAATFQLYLSVSLGPYLALLLISLLTPALDRLFQPKPLV